MQVRNVALDEQQLQLTTRPNEWTCADLKTIRGHVLCSFLPLLLHMEPFWRMSAAKPEPRRTNVLRNLDALTEDEDQRILVHSTTQRDSDAFLRLGNSRIPLSPYRIEDERIGGNCSALVTDPPQSRGINLLRRSSPSNRRAEPPSV